MKIGIVGPEEKSWPANLRQQAKSTIEYLIRRHRGATIISGGCPFGGVDVWAEEIARTMNYKTLIFKPQKNCWSHYRRRNIKIAEACDTLYCIVPYNKHKQCRHDGMKHPTNGGCWTGRYAQSIGKKTELYIVF